jgi:hypothetical protein
LYDLHLGLPFTFQNEFGGVLNVQESIGEKKISSDMNWYLGVRPDGNLYCSYTLLDLYYLQQISAIKMESLKAEHINLDCLKPRFEK